MKSGTKKRKIKLVIKLERLTPDIITCSGQLFQGSKVEKAGLKGKKTNLRRKQRSEMKI